MRLRTMSGTEPQRPMMHDAFAGASLPGMSCLTHPSQLPVGSGIHPCSESELSGMPLEARQAGARR